MWSGERLVRGWGVGEGDGVWVCCGQREYGRAGGKGGGVGEGVVDEDWKGNKLVKLWLTCLPRSISGIEPHNGKLSSDLDVLSCWDGDRSAVLRTLTLEARPVVGLTWVGMGLV